MHSKKKLAREAPPVPVLLMKTAARVAAVKVSPWTMAVKAAPPGLGAVLEHEGC